MRKNKIIKKVSSPVTNMIKNDFDDVPEIINTAKNRKKRKKSAKNAKSNLVGTLKSAFMAVALSLAACIYSAINKNTTPAFFFAFMFIVSLVCTLWLYVHSYTSGKLTMQELKQGLWSKKTKKACESTEDDESKKEEEEG